MHTTDDLRIRAITRLSTPAEVMRDCAATDAAMATVDASRQALHGILVGDDDRLAVVIGPCSIHNTHAALEYAGRLAPLRRELGDALEIVMRVYFEKPRAPVGWKGLINDPDLDGSFEIDKGLRLARGVLRDINALGVPTGCGFQDMITPQYVADLVTWGAFDERATESRAYRELASGLSCPVGFKNDAGGNLQSAVDAVQAASLSQPLLAVTKDGRTAIATTTGNSDCHVILRGRSASNYSATGVAAACVAISNAGLPARVMIDAHSGNWPQYQPRVVEDLATQIEAGETRIIGVMLKSHLVAGRQDLVPGQPLIYGQSITDGCIGWPSSVQMLERLAQAVRRRRSRTEHASVAMNGNVLMPLHR